jgi:hypothetical protein
MCSLSEDILQMWVPMCWHGAERFPLCIPVQRSTLPGQGSFYMSLYDPAT